MANDEDLARLAGAKPRTPCRPPRGDPPRGGHRGDGPQRGAILEGADLREANLKGTNLSGADRVERLRVTSAAALAQASLDVRL